MANGLSIRTTTIKLLEENIWINFHVLRFGSGFLTLILKTPVKKEEKRAKIHELVFREDKQNWKNFSQTHQKERWPKLIKSEMNEWEGRQQVGPGHVGLYRQHKDLGF